MLKRSQISLVVAMEKFFRSNVNLHSSFLVLLQCAWEKVGPSQHIQGTRIDDFEIPLDYTIGWDLLIWDLKGRVCFRSLIKIFMAAHPSALSSSWICFVVSHTALTADILLVIHFYISLCEVLLIHTPCLLHSYTYLILVFIHLSISTIYLPTYILSIYLSIYLSINLSLLWLWSVFKVFFVQSFVLNHN